MLANQVTTVHGIIPHYIIIAVLINTQPVLVIVTGSTILHAARLYKIISKSLVCLGFLIQPTGTKRLASYAPSSSLKSHILVSHMLCSLPASSWFLAWLTEMGLIHLSEMLVDFQLTTLK
jgi:hypothetical protein